MSDKKVSAVTEDETCMQKTAANWAAFKSFMWDPQNKAFMGRNARSWAEIGVFYLFYYGFLAAFFGSLMAIFYYGFIDQNQPTYTDKLGTPGLNHRPRNRWEENIAFNYDNDNTYMPFVDDVNELLEPYRNANMTVYSKCESGPTPADDKGRLCVYDLADLGGICNGTDDESYGFTSGTPCVYFMLNKVWGWQPKAYKEDAVPEAYQPYYDQDSVLIQCDGRKEKDRENIGALKYYPEGGLNFKYFPYVGNTDKNSPYRTNYLDPLVAVHFTNITKDVTVRVKCYARAANMEYGDHEGHVEFMVRVNSPIEGASTEAPDS